VTSGELICPKTEREWKGGIVSVLVVLEAKGGNPVLEAPAGGREHVATRRPHCLNARW
jgi:hypothetical protein